MSVKRKLTQGDLRRAMNEHKKKMGVVKKIESPLAKYTDAGQLTCILCKSIVRSEAVWPVHLNSRTHKENIALAKQSHVEHETVPTSTTLKRPSPPVQDHSAPKKIKSILKNNTQTQPHSSLPADFFDNAQPSQSHATAAAPTAASQTTEIGAQNETMENANPEGNEEKNKGRDAAQAVPEGFFDDPIMDARVRNVEYRNPIEEEWEKFQKEIKEEAAQSAQIIADDQEEATNVRQLNEIDEQMRQWSRVLDLVRRKDQFQTTERKRDSIADNTSSDDEDEFDEFLDWRSKDSYK